MPRHFTLPEAQGLLPRVQRLVEQALEGKSRYEAADASFQKLGQKVMLMGGLIVDRARALELKSERGAAATALKSSIETIHEVGCVVKDLDIGLVDFPTLFRGEEVYLCWKMGESSIQFWHGVDEGFAGRKPIDQDFLDNHRGESPD
jgi:hypothetical protein